MSQAGSAGSGVTPLPPTVATSYTTDVRNNTSTSPGTAIPAANVLQILGRDTNQNNDNGIRTDADPQNGNIVYVELTNRITGSVTTTDATPTTLASVSLGATPGVYLVQGDITAWDVTDAAGASYTFEGAATTDGATATEIGVEQTNKFEQAAMAAADFSFGTTANTAFVQVTGIAGKTINWTCMFIYRFVG